MIISVSKSSNKRTDLKQIVWIQIIAPSLKKSLDDTALMKIKSSDKNAQMIKIAQTKMLRWQKNAQMKMLRWKIMLR